MTTTCQRLLPPRRKGMSHPQHSRTWPQPGQAPTIFHVGASLLTSPVLVYRVTPQVPQNMQEDLQRMELEAREVDRSGDPASKHTRDPSLSTWMRPSNESNNHNDDQDFKTYQKSDSTTMSGSGAPSFSPFPKVKGDNIPPSDDEKEEILWNARKHVLSSQNVSMQITWARDVLNWAEISMEAAARENPDRPRPSTPRIEHELRVDALNIITYLAGQDHPQALYIRAKWLEFGKFGNRVDKREAYNGYKRAGELGHTRAEYRMGMLYEQSNDTSKAKEHYYRGMAQQDSASLYRLGMMSLLGQLGESKDYQTGLERIKAAADSSDEDAPQGAFVYGMLVGRELPDIYIPDSMLPNDPKTAMVYVEKSAYLGFAKAQHKMGQAFELCQFGCEFNPSYSLHYYGLAANQGNAEAALGVSRWFLFGYEGVFKKNEELAYKYAQQASAQKLATGEFAMGYYHEIGIHVEKSLSAARQWYQLAADHGNKDAIGRLESLNQDKTLSKKDHETVTLTRIKSQHGSQRGKRPQRFKQQAQQMPTLSEGDRSPVPGGDPYAPPKPAKDPSPQPSPGLRPTVVSEHVNFPDPSRASLVSDRPPAFNVRLDGQQPPLRPHSAAPYPEDNSPYPPSARPKSAAPYPEDDMRGQNPPGPAPRHAHGAPGPYGPQSDRPGSSFGVNAQGPPYGRGIAASQSMGNLHPSSQHPDPRGRIASTGGPGAHRQPSPGPASPTGGHPPRDPYGRPASGAPYPSQQYGQGRKPGPGAPIPPAGTNPGRGGYDPRMPQQTPTPHAHPGAGRPGPGPDRLGALPQHQQRHSHVPQGGPQGGGRPPMGPGPPMGGRGGGPDRVGSAPPSQHMQRPESKPSPAPSPAPSAATAPVSKPSKGPATFEDMGIPQGKQDGDCVSLIQSKLPSSQAC